MRRMNWGGSLGLGLTVWLLVCGFLFQREQLDAPDVVSVKEYTGVEAAVTAIGTAPLSDQTLPRLVPAKARRPQSVLAGVGGSPSR